MEAAAWPEHAPAGDFGPDTTLDDTTLDATSEEATGRTSPGVASGRTPAPQPASDSDELPQPKARRYPSLIDRALAANRTTSSSRPPSQPHNPAQRPDPPRRA